MQVKIEIFENFFQKRRFNNEFYTRLTCLKDIFCYQLANHYAQFDNKTRSLTTVLQGLPTSCQLELANCNLPLSLNSQSCLSRVPEVLSLYNEPTISQLEVLFMKINYKKLGKRIQSARKETGLSQEQLAEAIGKSPSAISTIETGKRGGQPGDFDPHCKRTAGIRRLFAGRSAAPHPLGAFPEIALLFSKLRGVGAVAASRGSPLHPRRAAAAFPVNIFSFLTESQVPDSRLLLFFLPSTIISAKKQPEVRSMVEHILPGTQEQAEESPFAPLLQMTGPQKGRLAQRRQRMGPARREQPSPAHPFHVAVYIRYFNQTRYENYLELHKKVFSDCLARCPNWDFVGFYIDEGSTAPRMESAKAWSRLL